VRPKSNQFQQVLKSKSESTANVMQLQLRCRLEPDDIYCEVGCQGATLIDNIDHPGQMAYAVNKFSELDTSEEDFDQLTENLSAFDLESHYYVIKILRNFYLSLGRWKRKTKSACIFYNGAPDYRSQMLGLL